MRQETLPAADEKFLFHMNNFDEGLLEDEGPPAPVFSEAELEQAKSVAYEKGRAEALQESKTSRAQAVAETLEKIAAAGNNLFGQEKQREMHFQQDALALCLGALRRVFPIYNKHHGFGEIQAQIESILQSHNGKSALQIHVAEDYVEGIEGFVAKIVEKNDALSFKVIGDDTLHDGAVQMSWADGGAVRDTTKMAEQIENALQEVLAGSPANRHDGVENNSDDALTASEGAPENDAQDKIQDNMTAEPPEAEAQSTIEEKNEDINE